VRFIRGVSSHLRFIATVHTCAQSRPKPPMPPSLTANYNPIYAKQTQFQKRQNGPKLLQTHGLRKSATSRTAKKQTQYCSALEIHPQRILAGHPANLRRRRTLGGLAEQRRKTEFPNHHFSGKPFKLLHIRATMEKQALASQENLLISTRCTQPVGQW